MKKKTLTLSKQTVANLSGFEQKNVIGGLTVHNSICLQTCKDQTCLGPHCGSAIPECDTEPWPTFPGWPRCK